MNTIIIGSIILALGAIAAIINLIAMSRGKHLMSVFYNYVLFIASIWLCGAGLLTTVIGAIIYIIQHTK